MRIKRVIEKRIRHSAAGLNVVADVNADVSVNVTEKRTDRVKSPPRTSRTTEERKST